MNDLNVQRKVTALAQVPCVKAVSSGVWEARAHLGAQPLLVNHLKVQLKVQQLRLAIPLFIFEHK
jgi:hypothetical protein